jgi:jumonji domain-containing protein 7
MFAAVENLIVTYHELNSSTVDELTSEPSPLEFMRYVARNRPFVVRGGAADWTATRHWNAGYLLDVIGSSNVNVAITPAGFVTTAATNISWAEFSLETRTR